MLDHCVNAVDLFDTGSLLIGSGRNLADQNDHAVDIFSVLGDDLDDLVGTWVQDDAFDKAMAEMDRVDEDLWR